MIRNLLPLFFLFAAGHAVAQVKGTASYRERMALPPTAVFETTLEDVSKAGVKAEVIGRARIERPANPPIAFEIPYDSSRIDEKRCYVVRARILVDGKLLFTTDQSYPVLTGGKGSEVTVTLRRVGAPSNASLENTYWKLTRLGDAPVTVAERQREPHFILHPASKRVSGSGGCNRITGSYERDGERLTFGQIAGTMMACQEGMDTEKEFLATLKEVRKAKVLRQQLQLLDVDGKLVARFEAVYLR